MFIRSFAICLAALFAAVPLAARADFWLNAIGTKGVPNVYGYSSCRLHSQSGSQSRSNAVCTGEGGIDISQRYDGGARCKLNVWDSGVFKTTWHAELTRNDSAVCSTRWTGDNTLEAKSTTGSKEISVGFGLLHSSLWYKED